jgi:enoyl-CoA hydratase/carnithine racemase
MAALVRDRLSTANLRDVLLTGARMGGEECLRRGMVDETVAAADVLPRAIARATDAGGEEPPGVRRAQAESLRRT